jgi:hypothetical protein
VTASLAIGGVLLVAMIAASGYGWVTLPADARVPVHCGSAERCYWAVKRGGLLIWAAIGVLGYGIVGAIMASNLTYNWSPAVREVLTPAVMCVALAFQAGALAMAKARTAEGLSEGLQGGEGRQPAEPPAIS